MTFLIERGQWPFALDQLIQVDVNLVIHHSVYFEGKGMVIDESQLGEKKKKSRKK